TVVKEDARVGAEHEDGFLHLGQHRLEQIALRRELGDLVLERFRQRAERAGDVADLAVVVGGGTCARLARRDPPGDGAQLAQRPTRSIAVVEARCTDRSEAEPAQPHEAAGEGVPEDEQEQDRDRHHGVNDEQALCGAPSHVSPVSSAMRYPTPRTVSTKWLAGPSFSRSRLTWVSTVRVVMSPCMPQTSSRRRSRVCTRPRRSSKVCSRRNSRAVRLTSSSFTVTRWRSGSRTMGPARSASFAGAGSPRRRTAPTRSTSSRTEKGLVT